MSMESIDGERLRKLLGGVVAHEESVVETLLMDLAASQIKPKTP